METWQTATERYRSRVNGLLQPLQDLQAEFGAVPRAPFTQKPEREALLCYRLCVCLIGYIQSASEVVRSLQFLWIAGHFLGASLCTRHLIELWGAATYANRVVLDQWLRTKDLVVAEGRVYRLMVGAKSEFPLPWELEHATDATPFSVTEFVRALEDVKPGTAAVYEFLSDGCHPSHVQHAFLVFAGAEYDNWSKDRFATYGHQLLDRTLRAAENALSGLREQGGQLLEAARPGLQTLEERKGVSIEPV